MPAERDPALDRLDILVGEWTLEAGPPGGPPWPGEASASFEWFDERSFLIQRQTVELPEAPNGLMLIGSGDDPGSFRQYYFDSRGVHRIYEMTLDETTWTLHRDDPNPFPQRFTGTFEDGGNTIAGRWEKRPEEDWEIDFELTYRRQGEGT